MLDGVITINDKAKVLMVDDDPLIREMFGSQLEAAGLSVSLAHDGNEGIEMAKKIHPDLIILDMLMPNMDGAQSIQALRDDPQLKNIPIIFLTSLENRPEDINLAKEMGAVAMFNKLVNMNEFIKKVKEVLAGQKISEVQ